MAIVTLNTKKLRIFEERAREIVATDVFGGLGDLAFGRV
jgi:hypothetical protein